MPGGVGGTVSDGRSYPDVPFRSYNNRLKEPVIHSEDIIEACISHHFHQRRDAYSIVPGPHYMCATLWPATVLYKIESHIVCWWMRVPNLPD
jgi:hypothetical protein